MADIFDAELSPGKLEVITEWVAAQDWASDLDLEREPPREGHRLSVRRPRR